jgi:indolepyruvate ferredoxin oxidoreductase alpha subunit
MTTAARRSTLAAAVAEGASAARVRLVAGHPGFPVTPILDALGERRGGWAFHLAVNERVALDMCVGASLGWARSLAVMKSHGASTILDPLQNWSLIGAEAGSVILVGDDVHARASQHGADSRGLAVHARIPLLEPSDPEELRSMLPAAFALSEEFRTPVMVRFTGDIDDEPPSSRPGPGTTSDSAAGGTTLGFRRGAGTYFAGPLNHARLRERADRRVESMRSRSWPQFNLLRPGRETAGNRRRGFVVAGTAHSEILSSYPDAAVLRCGLTYPLSVGDLAALGRDSAGSPPAVVEAGDPVLDAQVRAALDPGAPRAAPREEKGSDVPLDSSLCPRCPHRLILWLLRSLRAPVMGDAGCSALASLPPFESVDAHTAMGSSIGMATGLSLAAGEKAVAVIGDTAFRHSGINGVMNAVSCGADLLVVLLDNGVAGLTGGQVVGPPPGSSDDRGARWRSLLGALGVDDANVAVTDCVHGESTLQPILERSWSRSGVSVLVLVGRCAYARAAPIELNGGAVEERRSHPASVGCRAVSARLERTVLVRADVCGECTVCGRTSPGPTALMT